MRDRGKTLLVFTAREDNEVGKTAAQNVLRAVTETDSGVRVRQMGDADLERILELRSIVRWSADPRAFDLLRGVRDARWAVAEAPDGDLAGMVGAVPLGDIGVLCHLAVHDGHRGETLTFGDLPELYGVDRWSYGADRSALLFATLRLHPGRGLVVRDSTG